MPEEVETLDSPRAPAPPEQLLEEIAWRSSAEGNLNAAFLFAPPEPGTPPDASCVLYATAPLDAHPCLSAPVLLVQAIHASFPERARAISRSRVYATGRASLAARGMVRVAAKRMTDEIKPQHHQGFEVPTLVPVGPGGSRFPGDGLSDGHPSTSAFKPCFSSTSDPAVTRTQSASLPTKLPVSDLERLTLACSLADEVPRESGARRFETDRAIAALLVSKDGELLGWAANSSASLRDRTAHAELKLAQGYVLSSGRGLPPGSTLYASLKPCKMCAAMIWDATENPLELRVLYAKDDPGPLARHTVLDLGSEARRLAARSAEELTAQIQLGPMLDALE